MTYAFAGLGLVGILFGANCYWHLWKWARMCQRANIAIAYNKRVQLNAPLIEWLTWCRQLEGDEKSKGRTIYRNGKVTVAILSPKAQTTAKTTLTKTRRFFRAKKATTAT